MGVPICFRTTLIITLFRISGLELVTLLMKAFLHANSSVSIPRLLWKSTDCSRRTFILLYHQHIIVLQPSSIMSQQRATTLSSSVFVKHIKGTFKCSNLHCFYSWAWRHLFLILTVVFLRDFFEKSDDLCSELYLGLFYRPHLTCFITLQDFKSVWNRD